MTTSTKRDWVRMSGITGASVVVAGAVTMGGLGAARATGLVDVPSRIGMMGKHGGNMDGRGGMMGEHGGNMGGRGGMMGEHGGNMGGRGGMMGEHGGNMGGRGGMFARMMGDQSYLTHLLVVLQNEQSIANFLADSNTAAKVIAESRAKDIAVLTELQKTWYPDAAIPSTTVSTATIDDLKAVLLQNTVMIERISDVTFEHPELATWLNQHMIQRANEIASLYGQQS